MHNMIHSDQITSIVLFFVCMFQSDYNCKEENRKNK